MITIIYIVTYIHTHTHTLQKELLIRTSITNQTLSLISLMMLAQYVLRFFDFITVSIFVALLAVLSLRLFLKFATFLTDCPWRRYRTFTFRRRRGHSPPPYCAVCLLEAEEGEKMRRLTICRHCFHADCIDPWLCEMSSCPLCRAEIPPLPPANPLLLLFVPANLIDLFSIEKPRV